jgi:phosphotransferase system enzyme I (PtsI)
MGVKSNNSELRIEGIAVAPGVAHGPAVIWSQQKVKIPRWTISEDALPGETARLQTALLATRSELQQIQQRMAESIGVSDASIFDAHLLIVEDRTLLDEAIQSVQSNRHNIEFAFHEVADRYCQFLRETDDPYLRERVADIEDVTRRRREAYSGNSEPFPIRNRPAGPSHRTRLHLGDRRQDFALRHYG